MNELAERLRALRGQAGAREDLPATAPSSATGSATAVFVPPAPERMAGSSSAGLKALLRRHVQAKAPMDPAAEGDDVRPVGGVEGSRREGAKASRALLSAVRPSAEPRARAARPARKEAPSDAFDDVPVRAGSEIGPGLFEHVESVALAPPASWQWLPDLHPQLLPTECLLHFDTETTGLAGGTGTRAFMLGFARWRADGLEVRQLWINRLGAEAPMLERFAQWLSEAAFQLVSYNGLSFDAPLLRARYRLCRLHDPLLGLPHHDLLHPVRRRFKRHWPSCRLAEAEARLLGVRRVADLPGAQVPAAFLAGLRSGDPRPLQQVRRHHFQDLVSLAGLLPKLCGLSAHAPGDWSLD